MKTILLALSFAALTLVSTSGCKRVTAKQQKSADTPPVALSLSVSTAKVGEAIQVSFGQVLTPPAGQQYWLTLTQAVSPDSEWGEWHYVPAGASVDALTPKAAGAFEVRLHDFHPTHDHRVIGRQTITVGSPAAAPRTAIEFKVASTEVKAGQNVDVTFNQALVAPPGQQYWITLAPAGSPDSEWGVWHYVAANATSDKLVAAKAGTFEVRLQDLYPQHSHSVIQRTRVTVKK